MRRLAVDEFPYQLQVLLARRHIMQQRNYLGVNQTVFRSKIQLEKIVPILGRFFGIRFHFIISEPDSEKLCHAPSRAVLYENHVAWV